MVSYCHHVAGVGGPLFFVSSLSSSYCGQECICSVEGPFRNASGKNRKVTVGLLCDSLLFLALLFSVFLCHCDATVL